MKIKVKKRNSDGIVRLETEGEIMEVMLDEDFLAKRKEGVKLGFKGKNSSGIVEFDHNEIQRLVNSLNERRDLIRGYEVMKFDKD